MKIRAPSFSLDPSHSRTNTFTDPHRSCRLLRYRLRWMSDRAKSWPAGQRDSMSYRRWTNGRRGHPRRRAPVYSYNSCSLSLESSSKKLDLFEEKEFISVVADFMNKIFWEKTFLSSLQTRCFEIKFI